MNNTQLKRLNQVTNKMIINHKVFHARVEDRISEKISNIKVFREEGRRGLHWGSENSDFNPTHDGTQYMG